MSKKEAERNIKEWIDEYVDRSFKSFKDDTIKGIVDVIIDTTEFKIIDGKITLQDDDLNIIQEKNIIDVIDDTLPCRNFERTTYAPEYVASVITDYYSVLQTLQQAMDYVQGEIITAEKVCRNEFKTSIHITEYNQHIYYFSIQFKDEDEHILEYIPVTDKKEIRKVIHNDIMYNPEKTKFSVDYLMDVLGVKFYKRKKTQEEIDGKKAIKESNNV